MCVSTHACGGVLLPESRDKPGMLMCETPAIWGRNIQNNSVYLPDILRERHFY